MLTGGITGRYTSAYQRKSFRSAPPRTLPQGTLRLLQAIRPTHCSVHESDDEGGLELIPNRNSSELRTTPRPQMKLYLAKYSASLLRLSGIAALAMAASIPLRAQSTAASSSAQPADVSTSTTVTTAPEVVLDPFTVTTSKDKGYAATNAISGSRVDTPIKDLPIPITVITSEFIDDIGATNLRSALSYSSGIMLQTQNDLENNGSTYGSPYGAGGVNNPQGLTSNINQVQLKIRGFVSNNVLRDGFL